MDDDIEGKGMGQVIQIDEARIPTSETEDWGNRQALVQM